MTAAAAGAREAGAHASAHGSAQRCAPGGASDAPAIVCPFCSARTVGSLCLDCGRDKTAARRVCTKCHANTPLDDRACQACGHRHVSDLRWKVPLIVAMFAGACVAAVLLNLD